MDKQRAVAEKYAQAFFSVLPDGKARSDAGDNLKILLDALSASGANGFFLDPSVTADKKKALFTDSLSQKFSSVFVAFIVLLIENDRFSLLSDVHKIFAAMVADENNVVSGRAEFATQPTDAQVKELKRALAPRFGDNVELKITINKKLLGGVRAYVGSSMFDYTLDARLRALANYCADDSRKHAS